MAKDYSKDDFLQLMKRLGTYLSLKISNILHGQDLQSVWAVAGFAVAVIFTWRVWRTPSGPRGRQPKRQTPAPTTPGVGTNSNTNLVPSGVSLSSEDSRAQTVIDEFFQPVKPTLGQIVRQRLSEGRKVS